MKMISHVLAAVMVVVVGSSAASAGFSGSVDVDISGIATPFQMEVQLYSMSEPYGDSWVWLDNVVSGAEVFDFEDGTLQGFDDSLNPGSVMVVPGTIDGGTQVLMVAEDPLYLSTITFRDFSLPTTSVLSFDFSVNLNGMDSVVISLLDPENGEPLMAGLNEGYGDLIEISLRGILVVDAVSVTTNVIPVPGALGLGLFGVGLVRMYSARRHREE